MFLSDEDVEEMTGRQRKPAQSRVLTFMGVEHKIRPDGSLAVLRAHVEKLFGAGIYTDKKRKPATLRLDLVK